MPVAISLDVTSRGVWQPLDGSPSLPIVVEGTAPPVSYELVWSTSPSHTNPQPLAGASVVGGAHIILSPATGVQSVAFRLLDPSGAQVPIPGGVDLQPDGSRSESSAPFTYVGGAGATGGVPLDTTLLVNSGWTAVADVLTGAGAPTVTAGFVVANPTPVPPGAPTVRVETTSTGAIARLTAPGDPGIPAWTGYEVRWTRGTTVDPVIEVSKTSTSTSISLSATTGVYAEARAVGAGGASVWAKSNTVSYTAPVVSGRKDFTPLGGAQATATNRRVGIEVGIPSGVNLTARGSLTTSSTAGLQNLEINGLFLFTGTGTIYVRNLRVNFGGRGDPFKATNGGTIIAHDCEVNGLSTLQGRAMSTGSGGRFHSYRGWVHNMGEGPRMGTDCKFNFGRNEKPVLVKEFDGLNRTYGHDDSFQSTGGRDWEAVGNYVNGKRVPNPTISGSGVTGGPANGAYCYANFMINNQSGRPIITQNYVNGGAYGFNSHGEPPVVAIYDNLFGSDFAAGPRRNVPDLTQWISSSQRGWHPDSNVYAATGRPVGF